MRFPLAEKRAASGPFADRLRVVPMTTQGKYSRLQLPSNPQPPTTTITMQPPARCKKCIFTILVVLRMNSPVRMVHASRCHGNVIVNPIVMMNLMKLVVVFTFNLVTD